MRLIVDSLYKFFSLFSFPPFVFPFFFPYYHLFHLSIPLLTTYTIYDKLSVIPFSLTQILFLVSNYESKYRHGGSMILVRNQIPSFHPLINAPTSSFVSAHIQLFDTKLTIASIYIPPNSNINDQTFQDLFNPEHQIDIIAGDFNAKSPL